MRKSIKWLITLLGVVLIIGLLHTFAITSCYIPSFGMEDNLKQGDHILVNKWAYGLRLPKSTIRWMSKKASIGDIILFNNPTDSSHSEICNKELFISRCIATPGDTLWVDSLFQSQETNNYFNPDQKKLYKYPLSYSHKIDSLFSVLDLKQRDNIMRDSVFIFKNLSAYEYYLIEQALGNQNFVMPTEDRALHLYPLIVPYKGYKAKIESWNKILLYNTILLHENQNIILKNGEIFLENKAITEYTFKNYYYWMGSNNSLNISDSRSFGFVPHNHLIGKAFIVWFSKKSNNNPFTGYQWNRFFNSIY